MGYPRPQSATCTATAAASSSPVPKRPPCCATRHLNLLCLLVISSEDPGWGTVSEPPKHVNNLPAVTSARMLSKTIGLMLGETRPPGLPRHDSKRQRILLEATPGRFLGSFLLPWVARAAADALLGGGLTGGGLGEDAAHGGERRGRSQSGEESDRAEHGFYNPFGIRPGGSGLE